MHHEECLHLAFEPETQVDCTFWCICKVACTFDCSFNTKFHEMKSNIGGGDRFVRFFTSNSKMLVKSDGVSLLL